MCCCGNVECSNVSDRAFKTTYEKSGRLLYLSAQVEVAQQDGCLRARDDQNDEHQEEESIHVVDLGRPDRVQHEEQLDENATERQDASHHNPRNGLVGGGKILILCNRRLWFFHLLYNCILIKEKGEKTQDNKLT